MAVGTAAWVYYIRLSQCAILLNEASPRRPVGLMWCRGGIPWNDRLDFINILVSLLSSRNGNVALHKR
jgi:hypothetical protein